MKSRGIAAGASVIVLALTAAGPAAAAGIGDIAPKVNAETGAGVDANAQLGGVKSQANLDAYQWSNSNGAGVGHGTGAAGSVKVKTDGSGVPSAGGRQSGHVDGSVRVSPSIARSGKVEAHAGARTDTRVKSGHTSVKGEARSSTHGDLRVAKHARVKARARNRASVALSSKQNRSIGGERLVPKSKGGHSLPFWRIGREVGNPIQPLLAAWLLLLTAGICLGAARMARRRGHRFN